MRTNLLSLSILFLTLLAGVQTVCAQTSDEVAVTQAVESLRKAMIAKDRKQFEILLSDQMSYGHSAGRLETKAEFIADATSPRSVWKFIDLNDQSAQVSGNNAIVRHTMVGETESQGKTGAVKVGVLMVWTKQDGAWKLLARQAFRL